MGCAMWSRPQYTDLTYMGGTGSCRPTSIIFSSVTKSRYTSLNNKCGANRNFHAPKSPVHRFGLYGRYQILWTDEHSFLVVLFRVGIYASVFNLV